MPNGTYPVTKFWSVLTNNLKKNPRIDCFTDKVCNCINFYKFRHIIGGKSNCSNPQKLNFTERLKSI